MKETYAQKPWLKFYDRNVPASLQYPDMSYPEFIREAFERVPDRVMAITSSGAADLSCASRRWSSVPRRRA